MKPVAQPERPYHQTSLVDHTTLSAIIAAIAALRTAVHIANILPALNFDRTEARPVSLTGSAVFST